MITIAQYFRLNDWNEPISLANACVASEDICILFHGKLGRLIRTNLQHTTPLGKVTAIFFVLGTSLGQTIKSLSGALTNGSSQGHNTFVDFDPWNNAVVLQNLNKSRSIVCLLINSFVEKNDTTDTVTNACAWIEQKLSVKATVLFDVFNADVCQSFAHSARAFICS